MGPGGGGGGRGEGGSCRNGELGEGKGKERLGEGLGWAAHGAGGVVRLRCSVGTAALPSCTPASLLPARTALTALLLHLPLPPFAACLPACLQLLSAVAFLHDRWVMHRDLKLSNLLFTHQGQLKLCDYGLARYFQPWQEAYTPGVVTLWYRWAGMCLSVVCGLGLLGGWLIAAIGKFCTALHWCLQVHSLLILLDAFKAVPLALCCRHCECTAAGRPRCCWAPSSTPRPSTCGAAAASLPSC